MCDWRMTFTAPDSTGLEQRVSVECPDSSGKPRCYYHAKQADGLVDPYTDPWMKDVRVKVGKRIIWDGGRVGTPLDAQAGAA